MDFRDLPSAVVSAVLSYLVDADVANHGATDRSAAALTDATWHARIVALLPAAQRAATAYAMPSGDGTR